ncbi:MAG: hypothetical protein AAF399_18970 [Bacteroidota bacterium]
MHSVQDMISNKPHIFVIFASLLLLGLTMYLLLMESAAIAEPTTVLLPEGEDSLWNQTVSMIQDSLEQYSRNPR